jgi:hypothetical protein
MLLSIAGWLWWNLFRPLPSDAQLQRLFQEHRAELDRLAAMALADTQLVGAGHDWMLMSFGVYVLDTPRFNRRLSDDEVRSSRRIELRRLLDRAGLPSVSRSGKGDAVWFVVMSHAGGARKGIVYSERPLKPAVSSLDSLERVRSPSGQAGYVTLAPRWSLFLEPTD